MKRPHRPLFLILALAFTVTGFSQLHAEEYCDKARLKLPQLNFFKKFRKKPPATPPVLLAPYDQFDLIAVCEEKEPAVVEVKTVELRRVAFQKMEEHCCGIKMKGNYMRVTYQTFYSDGTSNVWNREYRS